MKITLVFAILCGLSCFTMAANSLGKEKGEGEGPRVGQQAPDFEMVGSDGKQYKLSDFRGKKGVVIAWFPKAFTGG